VSANERGASSIVAIQDLLTQYDGTRGYQPGSETDGVHDGSPYVTVNPMWYYDDTASDRGSRINGLCPEYGTPILPTSDSLREMMSESDLWPINKATWDYLDGDGFHGMSGNYFTYTNQYGVSSSIDEYAFKAQMFGGLAYRALWECWNANRFEYGDRYSTGLLFWYLNSPNRQTCGRMWDWSLEPTAALYFSQKAHEPIHAQYDFVKNTVSVNNEFPTAYTGLTLTTRILNFDMTEVYRNITTSVSLPADAFVKNIQTVTLPANLTPVHFIKLTLTDSSGNVLSDNFYWRSTGVYTAGRTLTGPEFAGFSDLSNLPKVTLSTVVTQRVENGKNYYRAQVTNPSASLAFMVWLRLKDGETNKPIRPAFYDDNFFSLLPGESRTIDIEYSDSILPSDTKLVVDGWNVARKQYRQGVVTSLPDFRSFGTGLANLAVGKTVTVSSANPAGSGPLAVDGNLGTRWSSTYSNNQWITVDLGSAQYVGGVDLSWETAYATQYNIQTSLDGTAWTTALTNNQGKGGAENLTFNAVRARYVRMNGITRATQYGFSLWEFAVHPPENLALNQAVTASTEQAGRPAIAAVDSDLTTTRWSSVALDNQWIAVDLGRSREISAVKLLWDTGYASSYKIQVSPDGAAWTDAAQVSNGTGGEAFISFPHVSARYVRMFGLTRGSASGLSLWDFAIYPYADPTVAIGAANASPVVMAQAAGVAYAGVPFPLQGTATDDGRPFGGILDTKWSSASGPTAAAFANVFDPATTVTFPAAGAYTLQLRASDGSASSTANLNLTVQSLYVNWAATYFTPAQLLDPAVSGAAADANQDGFSNYLAYATGTSPWVAGAPGTPVVTSQAGHLHLDFQRDTSALDATYLVEASDDLVSWQVIATGSLGNALTGSAAEVTETGTGRYRSVTVTDYESIDSAAKRFLRLRVTGP
ncbi:MAG TPA: discoidin domain-containing protein, partial [Chthoniobacterales bacterium]|nr:discoidin domain-containing protein [Chthoniobacterales bacterium]